MPARPLPDAARLEVVFGLADRADAIALRWFRSRNADPVRKADGSFVTRADREIEAMLRAELDRLFPGEAIRGEEGGGPEAAGGPRWILDPIDGTHNFLRGAPVFGTLLAFERDGTVELGVVSAPALGTRWWAARGAGAWRGVPGLRDRSADPIRVSDVADPEAAFVLYGDWPRTAARWPGAEALVRTAWRDRGFGDFWGHCLVAEGAADAMLDPAVSDWDVAALVPILEEAGGRIGSDRGGPVLGAGHAVSANAALFDAVLARLSHA